MKPFIGLTCSTDTSSHDGPYSLNKSYIDMICQAGGIPIVLPSAERLIEEDLGELLSKIDGLLLTGGPDVDPILYGEEPHPSLGRVDPLRDAFEMALTKEALSKGMPILGICRGLQVLNVVVGGSLHQDIPSLGLPNAVKHIQGSPRWNPSHSVILEEGSRLKTILGDRRILVNSFHHQAVKSVAPGFRVSARARDAIIEAIEKADHPFTIGLQWHPEALCTQKCPEALAIFKTFIEAC